MNTVILNRDKIHSGNLLLINAHHPVKVTSERDMIPADTRLPNIMLKREAANVLKLILDEISAGNSILPVSGYRSAKEQTEIYDGSLKSNGAKFTEKFVALPYHSEHQTGLAIDLALNKGNIDFICPDFPYEGICDDFRKIASRYGFIERYPHEKEQITGIAHEPWHFRYVGYPHSEIMKEKALTLEEYIDFIKQYPREKNHLNINKNGKNIEIFYVDASKADATAITLPEGTVYQISGNNTDGFIVTLWKNGSVL